MLSCIVSVFPVPLRNYAGPVQVLQWRNARRFRKRQPQFGLTSSARGGFARPIPLLSQYFPQTRAATTFPFSGGQPLPCAFENPDPKNKTGRYERERPHRRREIQIRSLPLEPG